MADLVYKSPVGQGRPLVDGRRSREYHAGAGPSKGRLWLEMAVRETKGVTVTLSVTWLNEEIQR